MEAQSVLYGKFKKYDTQIIFKTAKILNLGLKGLKKLNKKKFHRSSKTGPINGPNLPNQQLRPTYPVAQSTRFDPTIRSNMGLKSNHLTQTGRVRFRPKPDLTRPVDKPNSYITN